MLVNQKRLVVSWLAGLVILALIVENFKLQSPALKHFKNLKNMKNISWKDETSSHKAGHVEFAVL